MGRGRLIDTLAWAGLLSAGQTLGARALLDVLAAAGGGTLSVPLTLQDGLVTLGPVAIARLAPLF